MRSVDQHRKNIIYKLASQYYDEIKVRLDYKLKEHKKCTSTIMVIAPVK